MGELKGDIVLGRKFCRGCRRWRHVCDYHLRSRKPESPWYMHLKADCMTCSRIQIRERYRIHKDDLAYMTNKREYERILREGQRRARGIPPRPFSEHARRAPNLEPKPKIDAAPFLEWLHTLRPQYEQQKDMAIALGIEESHLGHLLNDDPPKPSVLLDTVDRALIRMGIPLWQIYPSLYPDVVPPGELEEAA